MRPPTDAEIESTRAFIAGSRPTLDAVAEIAVVYSPDKGFLRNQRGMDVRVGTHVAPAGGPRIYTMLNDLLSTIEQVTAFEFHVAYETLHPFLDGNGRTGRALWAWQMSRNDPAMIELGFLHAWYYQTLSGIRNF